MEEEATTSDTPAGPEKPKAERDTLAIGIATLSLLLSVISIYFQFFYRRTGVTATPLAIEISALGGPDQRRRVDITFAIVNKGEQDAILLALGGSLASRPSHRGAGQLNLAGEPPSVLKAGEVVLRHVVMIVNPLTRYTSEDSDPPESSPKIKVGAQFNCVAANGTRYQTDAHVADLVPNSTKEWNATLRVRRIDLLSQAVVDDQESITVWSDYPAPNASTKMKH